MPGLTRRRRGRRRARRGPRLGRPARRVPVLVAGTAALLVVCVGAAAAAWHPARPGGGARPTAAALLHRALARTLATSFHVTGTISEDQGSGVQQVTGDVDLPRHAARLAIGLGPGSAAEQVILLPDRTYQTLLAPAQIAAALPKEARWVVQPGSLPGLVLGADNALSALQPGPGQVSRVGPGRGPAGSYLLTKGGARPAATAASAASAPALPPERATFTVDGSGRVVSVQDVSYARTPFAQGGLAGVLATTIVLHLSAFGEQVRPSPPPAGETVSAARYREVLQGRLPASPTPPAAPGRRRSASR